MTKTPEQARRAWAVLDYIEAHPNLHEQAWWIDGGDSALDLDETVVDLDIAESTCGTTACIAGWTVLLAGHRIAEGWLVPGPNGELTPVNQVAADLLGLADDEHRPLFYDATDANDVRRVITDIYGPRPPRDLPGPAPHTIR